MTITNLKLVHFLQYTYKLHVTLRYMNRLMQGAALRLPATTGTMLARLFNDSSRSQSFLERTVFGSEIRDPNKGRVVEENRTGTTQCAFMR